MVAVGVLYALVAFNSIHGREALGDVALRRPTLHTGPGGRNQQDVLMESHGYKYVHTSGRDDFYVPR
jgi:hypothetical protein